eukprot:scaffold34621_cov88-Skeletonema_marinoi.AAC.1
MKEKYETRTSSSKKLCIYTEAPSKTLELRTKLLKLSQVPLHVKVNSYINKSSMLRVLRCSSQLFRLATIHETVNARAA